MPRLRTVLHALEKVAPARFAFSFDRVGLQVGDLDQEVLTAAVSLDRSLGAVEFAASEGAQLLLSHHPLIFNPLDSVDSRTHTGRTVLRLIRANISFVAAHTNWDSAQGGINDCLASLFDLQDVQSFGSAAEVELLKLGFYVPKASSEAVIDAVSEAGGGVVGAYRRCAFSVEGEGTFTGDVTTNPTIGEPGQRQRVEEVRVEMVVRKDQRNAVARALRKAHPYEEPGFDFLIQEPHYEQPAGRIGSLATPTDLRTFSSQIGHAVRNPVLTWGDPNRKIRKVAVVGGAADGEWMAAQREGADVLVTGEVKQHVALEASESGMAIVAAGHYATEHPGCEWLRARMANELPEINWKLFVPEPGMHGRPLES